MRLAVSLLICLGAIDAVLGVSPWPFPLLESQQKTATKVISTQKEPRQPPKKELSKPRALNTETLLGMNQGSDSLLSVAIPSLVHAREIDQQLAEAKSPKPIATKVSSFEKASETPATQLPADVDKIAPEPPIVAIPSRIVAANDTSHPLLLAPLVAAQVPPSEIHHKPQEATAESLLTNPPPQTTPPVVGTANRVIVTSVGIDIAVQSGSYDAATNTWEVDDSSAFHADTTVPVNDTNGTTLLYGHAKWGIFGALPDISEGAEAVVETAEGLRFVYSFDSIRQVDPSDVEMLTAEGAPRLVMQTCSGLFDQHRTLVLFSLKEVIAAGSEGAQL